MSDFENLCDKITIDSMFSELTPIAINTYNGKKVVFIVTNHFLDFSEFDGIVIEENKKDYLHKRNFVSNIVSHYPANKIIVLTQSPIVLSDAFSCQIYTYRNDPEFGLKFRYVGIPTFGENPSTIAQHVFRLHENVGKFSQNAITRWISSDWTGRIEELENICQSTGEYASTLKQILEKYKNKDGCCYSSNSKYDDYIFSKI